MTRSFALLVALSSTVVLAEELTPPPSPPEVPLTAPATGAPAPSTRPLAPLRPFSPGDQHRFRVPKGPIPAGFHLVVQPKWGLVVGGAVTLAVGLGAMVAYAVVAGDPLFSIPIAGPFIAVGDMARGRDSLNAGAIWIMGGVVAAVDVVAQIAGGALLVLGLAWPSRWLERDTTTAPRVTLVPGVAGAPLGASLVARF